MTAQRGAWVPLSAKDSPTDADPESQWCPSGSVPSQLSEACHHSVFWEKKPPRKVFVSRRASRRSEVSAPEENVRESRRPPWSPRKSWCASGLGSSTVPASPRESALTWNSPSSCQDPSRPPPLASPPTHVAWLFCRINVFGLLAGVPASGS